MIPTKGLVKLVVLVLLVLAGLGWGQPASAEDDECVNCHTDAEKLRQITDSLAPKSPTKLWRAGEIESLPRAEKVLIENDFFDDENHADISCDECHGGDPEATDFETAHKDVVRDPSFPAPGVCADCHDQAENIESNLHFNLAGMKEALKARASADQAVQAKLETAFNEQCAKCHSSCGQCHISRPAAAGGGLVSGHVFERTPDMDENCIACHGRGTGDEFVGNVRAYKPDFHFDEGGMYCEECHTADEMHGDGEKRLSRYEVVNGPKCIDCHDSIYTDEGENKEAHALHKNRVSCQVCHAQPYANCTGCHMNEGAQSAQYAKLDNVCFDLKIGLNPKPTELKPEKFVTLRRVPADRDVFKAYAPGALANFNNRPTWTMATPHNIQRSTEQNKSCNTCHGNWKFFLTLKDVEKDDRPANRQVIVPPKMIPKKVEESEGN